MSLLSLSYNEQDYKTSKWGDKYLILDSLTPESNQTLLYWVFDRYILFVDVPDLQP